MYQTSSGSLNKTSGVFTLENNFCQTYVFKRVKGSRFEKLDGVAQCEHFWKSKLVNAVFLFYFVFLIFIDRNKCSLNSRKVLYIKLVLSKVRLLQRKTGLSRLYWLPKLHKWPYKACFIINSSSCTTIELSKLFTSCLTAIKKKHLIKYYEKVYERSGLSKNPMRY